MVTYKTTDMGFWKRWSNSPRGAAVTLLPLLLRRADSRLPKGAHRTVAEHLAVGLVMESAPTQLLGAAALARLGLDFDRGMAVALENLAGRSRQRLRRLRPGLYLSPWGDGFDATRLLLGARWDGLPLRGQPVVLAANRDVLLVSGSEQGEGLRVMAACAEALTARAGAVSAIPLCWLGDGWAPYVPAPHEPAQRIFRRLQLAELADDYRCQRQRLRDEGAAAGHPFVASYSLETEDAEPFSYSVWTKGVTSLLPRSERVALVDPDADGPPQLRDFAEVEPYLRASAPDTPLYPPRYVTGEFPDLRSA